MIRRLVIIPAVILLLLAGFAAALAIADVYYQEGAAILESLIELEEEELAKMLEEEQLGEPAEQAEMIPEQETLDTNATISWALEQAPRFLWVAHRLDPWNPKILRNLGLMHELRVTEDMAHEPAAAANLNRALYYYRQSIAQRPAWPYVWNHIATLKLKQERLDREFALAMERATTLGPWEWAIQVEIVDVGLALWDELPEEQREIVKATIKRGLQIESEIFANVAEQMGLIESAEEYLAMDSPSSIKR